MHTGQVASTCLVILLLAGSHPFINVIMFFTTSASIFYLLS